MLQEEMCASFGKNPSSPQFWTAITPKLKTSKNSVPKYKYNGIPVKMRKTICRITEDTHAEILI
jgi:hypothetical protein